MFAESVARSTQVEGAPPSGTEVEVTEASGFTPHASVAVQKAIASCEARSSGEPGVGVVVPLAEVLHPARNARSNAGEAANGLR